ncbi:NEMP family [Senna tora]|uniref:NEMP family n=1 Tax=Senna tora TaxID=362788 RepID=A0A834W0K5_9FABA|nr:NEMP family [Senna tora]
MGFLLLLPFFISINFLAFSAANHDIAPRGIDLEKPVLDVSPSLLPGKVSTHGGKGILRCERIRVSGLSRLKLGSYASSFRITLAPSAEIPEKFHNKIQICFHRNNSLGWCQCEKDEFKSVQKGIWSAVMSPYDKRYVDVSLTDEIPGSVTVALEEDFQQWRLVCLALGFVLLLLAPIISSWVPFYYSSSMAIGVFLVIIILLFQGMKLLPTGRKNIFYLTIYGSVLGAGSFLMHHFSVFINSILQSFGLSEEMHNPVAVFVLVGIILAGAALGYWIVRKFVISKDGGVDSSVAQFVKWAMRILGATFILQSTLDPPLAIGALVSCGALCKLISSIRCLYGWYETSGSEITSWRAGQVRGRRGRAEFLSIVSPASSGMSPPSSGAQVRQDYYSTFHKTRNRKKFTKKEWDDFTRESTRQALSEWASSPEFTEWIIEHADRIQLLPSESSDATEGSESDNTDVGSEHGYRLFNWQ